MSSRARRLPQWLAIGCALLAPLLHADELEPTRQLLEWSGTLALLEQAQPIAELVLQQEQARIAQPLSAPQQRQLLAHFKASTLQRALAQRIAAQLPAETAAQAQAVLQQPLPKRVRFFERAMTQPEVEQEWQQWREQTPPASPARLQLLRAVDAAARDSAMTAILQTAVEQAVRQQLGIANDNQQQAAIAERQQHLQPFTDQYLYYAYRYLRDDELQQYTQLLQDKALQQLLDQIGKEMAPVIADAAR